MMSAHFVNASTASTYFEHTNEYYTQNMTNYDRFHGALAESLGMIGELSKEQFDELTAHIKARAQSQSKDKDRAGLDCTFSAPKSVSLAMCADEATRAEIIACHQKAVARIADKIEQELIQTRAKGERFKSRNMVACEFVHELARPTKANGYVPDLDLHSHLVVLNLTSADGQEHAVDYAEIMTRQKVKELGLDYRVELARELQAVGYELEVTDARQGFFELKGFDRSTIERFSNRAAEVKATAQEHGIKAKDAVIKSRSAKSKSKASVEDVRELTRTELIKNGIEIKKRKGYSNENERNARARGTLSNVERGRGLEGTPILERDRLNGGLPEFSERYSVPELRKQRMDSTARQADLLLPKTHERNLAVRQATRARSYYLRVASSKARSRIVNDLARSAVAELSKEKFAFTVVEARERIKSACVLEGITEGDARSAMQNMGLVQLGHLERDGKPSKDVYLTTKSNLEKEKAIIDRMNSGKGIIKNTVLTPDRAESELKRIEDDAIERGLTDFSIRSKTGEQARAVEHILTSSDQYVCVNGLAGTGKTTMCQRLKWVADEYNIKIKGLAFTGKASDGLQADSGIKSTTIHSFLNELEGKRGVSTAPDKIKNEWDFTNVKMASGREVWLIDEAGLVDTNLMTQVQLAAEKRGAQVVLMGDPLQLPPVGAGTPMRDMIKAGASTATLKDIFRQQHADEAFQRAVRESVEGDTLTTFKTLDVKGQYHQINDRAERMNAIRDQATEYKLSDYSNQLVIVTTNADRKAFNQSIRAEYVKRGELQEGQKYQISVQKDGRTETETRHFAQGDRLIFCQNDKRLGVKNGTMATIERIDGDKFTVRTDGKKGKEIQFDINAYDRVDHAYAVTNYKSQGMTVDRAIVDMNTSGTAQTRNALYVDVSRARLDASIYTDDKAKLERQTLNFAKKITSEDFSKRVESLKLQGIREVDKWKATDLDRSEALKKALADIEKHSTRHREVKPRQEVKTVEIEPIKAKEPPSVPLFVQRLEAELKRNKDTRSAERVKEDAQPKVYNKHKLAKAQAKAQEQDSGRGFSY